MPFVRIDLVRGRDKALLMRLVEEVSQVVAGTLVNEVDPDLWGIGGVPYSVARGPVDPGPSDGS